MAKKECIELIVPARDIACLEAAITAGCDSVYLSLHDFDNSDSLNPNHYGLNDFEYALILSKLSGVKVYCSFDGIIKNSELNQFFERISYVFQKGIQGIILQDISLIKIIKDNYPDLKIIISDKASLMNSESINQMKEADRIILPKELTKEEIIQIKKNVQHELEMTVQGWQCFSYGGQCLMSSMQGLRSANKNKCTYECRKPYRRNETPLSLKDISLAHRIPEIVGIGIKSLRINGWIKSPFYIYHVTDIYRRAIDSYYNEDFYISRQDRNMLLLSLKRQLTDGFYGKDKNIICNSNLRDIGIPLGTFKDNKLTLKEPLKKGDTISFRKGRKNVQLKIRFLVKGDDRVHEAKTGESISLHFFSFKDGIEIFKTGITETEIPIKKKYPINIEITIKSDENVKVSLGYSNEKVTVESEEKAEIANKFRLDEGEVKSIFNRVSQSPFFIDSWNIEIDKDSYISYSTLNKLKHKAINLLLDRMIEKRSIKNIKLDIKEKRSSIKECQLYVRVYDFEGIKEAHHAGARIIYYDIFNPDVNDALEYGRKEGIKIYLITPRVVHESSLVHIKKLIEHYNPEGILTGDKALLSQKIKPEKHLDYNFNITNDLAIDLYENIPILSVELNAPEILNLKNKEVIIFAHGRPTVMTSRIEIKERELVNDKMERFKVIQSPYKQTIILNHKEISLIDDIKELYDNGFKMFFLDLPKNVSELINIYKDALSGNKTVINSQLLKINNELVS